MIAKHELWKEPLLTRMALLRPGTTRIAYVAAAPDLGTFRYRAFNPVDCLRDRQSALSASYFFLSDLEKLDDLSDIADVLVAVRLPYDARVDRLFRKFSRRGKRVFFDIDDLVIDASLDTVVASNLGYQLVGESLYWWSAFISNWNKTLSLADEIITTTATLAGAIAGVTSKPIHVIPNTFNRHQNEVSSLSERPAKPAGALHLGYFSGSKSHEHDFDVVAPALVEFLSESPESRLTLVGHLDIGRKLHAVSSQVKQKPFVDFLELQRELSNVDLNIVPLQRSPFTDAKSELKYFEAAIAGTPTSASANPVFSSVITDGLNGFLAKPTEWGSKLRAISGLSAEELRQIGGAAREHAFANYSPDALHAHLERIFVHGA